MQSRAPRVDIVQLLLQRGLTDVFVYEPATHSIPAGAASSDERPITPPPTRQVGRPTAAPPPAANPVPVAAATARPKATCQKHYCRHFLVGRCTFGVDCRFLHVAPDSL
eukprot:TRINITY_DN24325_c0_g1_i1.p1 TRINITY_DN24325_c0_g1~~TRINITY_DN24325_c0_g1_i1.p1  ORF type:complete len:125 (+),score=26.73 TRINITY_DN24325_c0_g1_i1:50-376(+)